MNNDTVHFILILPIIEHQTGPASGTLMECVSYLGQPISTAPLGTSQSQRLCFTQLTTIAS